MIINALNDSPELTAPAAASGLALETLSAAAFIFFLLLSSLVGFFAILDDTPASTTSPVGLLALETLAAAVLLIIFFLLLSSLVGFFEEKQIPI
jgi:hypothetical protein